jgi:nitronate monooxygenase
MGVKMWPDNQILDLFGIQVPIIQAPMAGAAFSDMVVTVSQAGGLGSLACALLSVEQAHREFETIRRETSRPINANFCCHQPPRDDRAREMSWRQRLDPYFVELGLDSNTPLPNTNRAPFDDKMCDLIMEFHPEIVSFHFGLPDKHLLLRVRATGAKIVSSATSVDEARRLEDEGCDAIIAQGYEAGGRLHLQSEPDRN